MADMYVSRLRVTLCTLTDNDDVAHAEKDTELGELVAIGGTFTLNAIPTMQVTVPLGTSLASGPRTIGSYAYYKTIQEAFLERKPVGVLLESSDQIPGMPRGKVWLFKGYIEAASPAFGPGSGTLQLTLIHWLRDLDLFAVLNRLSSPDNGADLSQNPIFQPFRPMIDPAREDGKALQPVGWIVSNAIAEAFRDNPNDIFAAIKKGLDPVLQEGEDLNAQAVGRLPQRSVARMRSALEAIQSRYLEFWKPIAPDQDPNFLNAIIKTFNAQRAADYYSVTLWPKLLQLLSGYYVCVIPCVDEAYATPAPGMHMDDSRAFTIPVSKIINLRLHKTGKSMLGGMILADATRTIVSSITPKQAVQPSYHMYPERPNPGFIKVCFMPPWLSQVMLVESSKLQPPRCFFYLDHAADLLRNQKQNIRANENHHHRLCDAYVKSAYLAEITREHTATLTTPLNLYLVPGDIVKIEVPRDLLQNLKQEYIYGTISAVSYEISGGRAVSNYTLTNLQNEELMKQFENADALIYEEGWRRNTDTAAKLYAELEVPKKKQNEDKDED